MPAQPEKATTAEQAMKRDRSLPVMALMARLLARICFSEAASFRQNCFCTGFILRLLYAFVPLRQGPFSDFTVAGSVNGIGISKIIAVGAAPVAGSRPDGTLNALR